MLKSLASTTSWLYTLGKKFFKVAPLATTTVIFMSLVSQIALILVSLLPLQIIILLGAGRIPRFLPKQLASIEINTLVIGMSALTAICCILKFIADKIGENTTKCGAEKLLAASYKIAVFEDHDKLASSSYKNYADALAGAIFGGLALIAIGALYPNAAIFLIIGIAASLILLFIFFGLRISIREYVKDNFPKLISAATTFLFFYILIFIVIEFLYFSPPKFIFALLTIILTRQFFKRISNVVGGISALRKNKEKINTLFFRNKVYNPNHFSSKSTVWDLLQVNNRHRWIKDIFLEIYGNVITKFDVKWQQTNIKNLVCVKVLDLESNHYLLIKLYAQSQASFARHEATLLTDCHLLLPTPPFILATTVNNFHCNVFDITKVEKATEINPAKANKVIREQLLMVEPPASLAERYSRSKPMLWDRADGKIVKQLRLISSQEDVPLINLYNEQLPMISNLLKDLPLTFNLPEINRNFLYQDEDNNLLYGHWGSWRLEPTGAGWSVKTYELSELSHFINFACKSRTSLKNIPSIQYELAALIYAIESNAHKQCYKNAISLLPSLPDRLKT